MNRLNRTAFASRFHFALLLLILVLPALHSVKADASRGELRRLTRYLNSPQDTDKNRNKILPLLREAQKFQVSFTQVTPFVSDEEKRKVEDKFTFLLRVPDSPLQTPSAGKEAPSEKGPYHVVMAIGFNKLEKSGPGGPLFFPDPYHEQTDPEKLLDEVKTVVNAGHRVSQISISLPIRGVGLWNFVSSYFVPIFYTNSTMVYLPGFPFLIGWFAFPLLLVLAFMATLRGDMERSHRLIIAAVFLSVLLGLWSLWKIAGAFRMTAHSLPDWSIPWGNIMYHRFDNVIRIFTMTGALLIPTILLWTLRTLGWKARSMHIGFLVLLSVCVAKLVLIRWAFYAVMCLHPVQSSYLWLPVNYGKYVHLEQIQKCNVPIGVVNSKTSC